MKPETPRPLKVLIPYYVDVMLARHASHAAPTHDLNGLSMLLSLNQTILSEARLPKLPANIEATTSTHTSARVSSAPTSGRECTAAGALSTDLAEPSKSSASPAGSSNRPEWALDLAPSHVLNRLLDHPRL